MIRAADARFMALALSIGRRSAGQTWPNPAVGCVIVKDGRIVARGATAPGGRPHAETEALARAGAAARGATAYVTLEPCAHHGGTPPCADALIAAGVARVVIGCTDPDPRVAGEGMRRLGAAGIAVEEGVLETEARAAHAGFLHRIATGRPMVTLKLATTLDGRIATATGESQWITGPAARHAVHGLRASHDAVMVGAGTARADDPALTVRGYGARRQPLRVVLSRKLDLPLGGQLARSLDVAPLALIHGGDAPPDILGAWQKKGATCAEVPASGRELDLGAALMALGGLGIGAVFCEGGETLAAALLAGGWVDRLVVMSAGMALGAEGTPAIGALGVDRLAEAPRFELRSVEPMGPDVIADYRRQSQA